MPESGKRGRGRALMLALSLAAGTGCGIGDSVSDDCLAPRLGYERAQRMLAGLRQRGVQAQHPQFRMAAETLRDAQISLSSCTAGSSG